MMGVYSGMIKIAVQRFFLSTLLMGAVHSVLPSSEASSRTDAGFPLITQYTSYDYEAHVQNWGFAFDDRGKLYVANLAGPLFFNGTQWETLSIPNRVTVSILKGPEGRIWVGGHGEIGFLSTTVNASGQPGRTEYTSLTHLIDEDIQFGEVWEIADDGKRIYFITNDCVFIYDQGEIETHHPEIRYSGYALTGDKLLIREAGVGLVYFENGKSVVWENGSYFRDMPLMTHFEDDDKSIFCSHLRCYQLADEGMVEFQTEADSIFRDAVIHEAIVLRDGTYLFATRRGGLVQTDADGRLIRVINEETGLTSDSVLGIVEDSRGSVWVATVNGINRIDFSLPLRRFDARSGITSRLTGATEIDGEILFSSTSGIFHTEAAGRFQLTETPSDCNDFFRKENSVYLLCSLGLYLYENHQLTRVDTEAIPFAATTVPGTGLTALINQEKLQIGYLSGSRFEPSVSFPEIGMRPAHFTADENLSLWAATGSDGLLQIELILDESRDIVDYRTNTHFTDTDHQDQSSMVSIAEIDGRPHFLTYGWGINRFDHEEGNMVQVGDEFGDFFTDDSKHFFRAGQDHHGNVWFRYGSEIQGALRQADGSYSLYEGALKHIRDSNITDIFTCSNEYVWFLTDRGVIRFDTRHSYDHSGDFHTQLNQIIVRGDTLTSERRDIANPGFDYSENEIRFTFESFDYQSGNKLEFRVKLEGFDQDWSLWSSEHWKDYTNIREGQYSFQIEARNIYGTLSAAAPFSFIIYPPWYRTWWAYVIYGLLAVMIIYTGYRIRLNQVLREQRIRNRIAGDLHDEVSATLSSISYFAAAIHNDTAHPRDARFIKLIADSAGDAKEKITDIVWAINPEHDDWKTFLAKCRRYASDLLDSKNITYSMDIDNDIAGPLNMQFRQHLWMIFKEILTNAARHSDADHVQVKLKLERGRVHLVIHDNGKGIDTKDDFGNGLTNIRKRAAEIKAEVSLESRPGEGTRWKISARP